MDNYRIFLDDIRMPTDIYPSTDNSDWLIIRNLSDFKDTIEKIGIDKISYISFDNDLGDNMEEGKDAAKWIVFEKELDISEMDFKVHSANSSGVREYVEGLLNNWKVELKKIKDENVITRKEIRETIKEAFSSPKERKFKFDIQLPQDIIEIKNFLKERGFSLYVVGGAVRDALLGKEPKDFDLATDALPDVVQEILRPYYKTLETGKAFGVINVITPNGEYEIATFRKDLSGGRRPDAVEFTTIDQDVKRRDLTINALFYDIDKSEVVDLVGGIDDLRNKIIKPVGDAQKRFEEDPLRIMRFFRFLAKI